MATTIGKKQKRELWGLLALFGVFLASTLYYERMGQTLVPKGLPSAVNTTQEGVEALYRLLDRLHYPVARLTAPLGALSEREGLVVFVEPFLASRPVRQEEIKALRKWVEAGGTALYFVTLPARPLQPEDTVFGDVEVKAIEATAAKVSQSVPPLDADSPYVRDVALLSVQSPVRLKPAPKAGYTTLFRDDKGMVALQKRLGKGNLLIVADVSLLRNTTIKEADNVVFLANIAAESVGRSGRRIVFDEYHHGDGFVRRAEGQPTWLEITPPSVKLAFWHLLSLGALLVYNGNVRLGVARRRETTALRPSADYLGSMARLLQRAGATDIALVTLYHRFRRDLIRHLDMAPDATLESLVTRAAQRFQVDGAALQNLITRCEQAVTGQRFSEGEMVALARQIEQFRRSCQLV